MMVRKASIIKAVGLEKFQSLGEEEKVNPDVVSNLNCLYYIQKKKGMLDAQVKKFLQDGE